MGVAVGASWPTASPVLPVMYSVPSRHRHESSVGAGIESSLGTGVFKLPWTGQFDTAVLQLSFVAAIDSGKHSK